MLDKLHSEDHLLHLKKKKESANKWVSSKRLENLDRNKIGKKAEKSK